MNNSTTRSGKYITQATGYKSFIPNPLPPNPPLIMDEEMVYLLSEANLALGKLAGLTTIIVDPDLFVYLYVRKEALLSSQIEGTQCSLEDILAPDAAVENPGHSFGVEEVSNYVKAMNQGLSRLNELPVCTRLIKEIHQVLMDGVRGQNKTPGEFRRSQNWIGRPGCSLMDAEFVPPPFEMVDELMGDVEKFIHDQDKVPPLVKAALIHAQFETIHPFLDGNGRLGRLLITYLLCYWQILDRPLLYLSYYFKSHLSEYYNRLMKVRHSGEWEQWILFFLRGVKVSAEVANKAAVEIHHLHQQDKEKLMGSKASKFEIQIFNEFCHNPVLTAKVLLNKYEDANKPKIQRCFEHLIKLEIIKEVSGKIRNRKYIYGDYLSLLTKDT
ncbi:MAG: Fic family protein [Oligoflexia bacterium]|nr:Fic family protein [Oligoflexia bacterium]